VRMQKLMGLVVFGISLLPQVTTAQYGSADSTISAGDVIPVRMSEDVAASQADGRIFAGTVDSDLKDTNGRVAIPAGSRVELTARSASGGTLALDLESITVNGQRYAVNATSETTASRQGVGANKTTAIYVGGGALLGSILGAAVGGGKGAAIGAATGAAAGAGTQIVTRGKSLNVPRGSLVTFRLDHALDVGVPDTGVTLNGNHYHRY
jgi:hypothetical protein